MLPQENFYIRDLLRSILKHKHITESMNQGESTQRHRRRNKFVAIDNSGQNCT